MAEEENKKIIEQDKRFDANNRPIGYIAGGVAGQSSVPGSKTYPGVDGKAVYGLRFGYDFLEIDIWDPSEVFQSGLADVLKDVREVNKMEMGVHMSVNTDWTSALGPRYEDARENMNAVVQASAKAIKARFCLIHSSTSPIVDMRTAAPRASEAPLVDPWGENLGDFIMNGGPSDKWLVNKPGLKRWDKKVKTGDGVELSALMDWFLVQFTKEVLYPGTIPDAAVMTYLAAGNKGKGFGSFTEAENALLENEKKFENEREKVIKGLDDELASLEKSVGVEKDENKRRAIIQRMSQIQRLKDDNEQITRIVFGRVPEDVKKLYRFHRLDYRGWTSASNGLKDKIEMFVRGGSAGGEAMAYKAVAKWMEAIGDPLWTSLVSGNKDCDAKIRKNLDEIITALDTSGTDMTTESQKAVTAVAAKYLQGQLMQPMSPRYEISMKKSDLEEGMFSDATKKNPKPVYRYMFDEGMHFYIETTQPGKFPDGRSAAGKMRILHITDHMKIIKAFNNFFGFENISYTIDFEHLNLNHISPLNEAKKLDKGDGKYISMIHMNPPSAEDGLHRMLHIYSRDMEEVYKILVELKKQGMTNAYFIWEIGKESTLPMDSVVSFRTLIRALNEGVDPKKLPPWFFGIDENFKASQHVAMIEHAFDPIKGLLKLPEEEHGVIGDAARTAGRVQEYAKGRYR